MWPGFDPEIARDLATVKMLVGLCHRAPTHEWPLIFVAEHDALLVVRQWPNGEITAYWTSETRNAIPAPDGD
jgi:hypothetical protein